MRLKLTLTAAAVAAMLGSAVFTAPADAAPRHQGFRGNVARSNAVRGNFVGSRFRGEGFRGEGFRGEGWRGGGWRGGGVVDFSLGGPGYYGCPYGYYGPYCYPPAYAPPGGGISLSVPFH